MAWVIGFIKLGLVRKKKRILPWRIIERLIKRIIRRNPSEKASWDEDAENSLGVRG
jgi:hypothetical protein